MTREARTVLLLLGLAVTGHAVRWLLGRRAEPPGQILTAPRPAADAAAQRARSSRLARALAPGEQIDLNSASADEIARLPRVGMSLAKRMVADRTAHGEFRGLGDLDRVPGVGPGLLAVLEKWVRFGVAGAGKPVAGTNGANPSTSGIYSDKSGPDPGRLVDLNSASLADLKALPGIGSARARAILAYRRENGPFAVVSDLGRVPGLSQALVARLAPYLTAK